MAKLDSNPTLMQYLDGGAPFVYGHLVKFERPYKIGGTFLDNGDVDFSTKYTKYAYITDAGFDIGFNDGSTYWDTTTSPPTEGVANGTQIYRANKLIKVGSVSETADTKISNISITLDATSLDAALYGETVTLSGNQISATNSFVEAGFREGDVVLLSSTASPRLNNNKSFRITGFRSAGTVADVQVIDSTFTNETSVTYDLTIASSEITALKDVDNSINFINRRIYVYKAFFNPEDPSVFIGTPVLLFSGLVTSAEYKEDISDTPTITWTAKSHWGDFQQVRGRIGSDEFHRALDGKGNANHRGVLRPEYAYDMGFQHADKAIDVMGVYTVMETRYKKKTKSNWAGSKKIKLIPYEVPVPKEVDLRFNLSAKYIPVVYGVRRVEGTPVFVDTSATDPGQVYMVESLCEGPIQGILNVYVEDNPLICTDEADYNVRGTGSTTVDVACHGRADRGDVLVGSTSQTGTGTTAGTVSNYVGGVGSWNNAYLPASIDWSAVFASIGLSENTYNLGAYTGTSSSITGATSTGGEGLTHEKGFNLSTPMDIKMTVKSGNVNQVAEARMVEQAKTNSSRGFKLQSDNNLNPEEYWGTNHRLLDTAYVTNQFTLTESQSNIPDMEYVVKGRLIPSYNYDGSFSKDPGQTSAAHTYFSLGETVSIYKTSDNSLLASNVQIIDKWFFYGFNGTQDYRFRWSLSASQEKALQNAKAFYMTDSISPADRRWYMVTYDYEIASNIPIQETLRKRINSYSGTPLNVVTDAFGAVASITGATGQVSIEIDGDPSQYSLSYGKKVHYPIGANFNLTTGGSPDSITLVGSNSTGFDLSRPVYLNLTNKIRISTSASAVNDYYNGMVVRLTKYLADGTRNIIYRNITDYDGASRTLVLDYPLATEEIPVLNDTVDIILADQYRDLRPSTNFAIILLDYLTSKRYGAGLSLDDLNVPSFLQAARTCDTTSDITVRIPAGNTIVIGDVYKYESTSFKWQGTVKSYTTNSDSTVNAVFTNCIGKLTNKFNNWKSRDIGDVIYADLSPNTLFRITSAGVQSSISTNATSSFTFSLSRVSGTGTATVNLATNNGNPIIDHSLYDSDFIKYWKYLGWDSQDQRWVTRYQGNLIIDTSEPVFSNIDFILQHFDGVLAFEDGKYSVYIEAKKDADKDLWWNFQGSTEGWAAATISPTATLTTYPTYMNINGTNTNPFIQKTGLSFYGGDQKIIRAKVRRTSGSGWLGKIEYSTTTRPTFDVNYFETISDTTQLNEWVVLSWNMSPLTSGGSDWDTSYITGLKLTLGATSADDFDIEWISCGATIRVIEPEDIVGGIGIKDEGLSKSYNSLSANISDPQNNFSGRSVSFFNSQYLSEDKGIVRSTNFSLDGITNYYNARMAVEQILRKSRYARTITFTLRPSGMALTPSDLIRVIYPRFAWDEGKYFRVTSLTHREDCLVSVVAEEYNDNIYFIEASKKGPYASEFTPDRTINLPSAPTGLLATSGTSEQLSQITLTWTAISELLPGAFYEIWRSADTNIGNAKLIDTIPSTTVSYVDVGFTNTVSTSFYYWLRTGVTRNVQLASGNLGPRTYYSPYTSMATGTTKNPMAALAGSLTRDSFVVSANSAGVLTASLANAGGTFEVRLGSELLLSPISYYVGATGTSPAETKNGLRLAITSSGVYSLAESPTWLSNYESFTLRAVHSPSNITLTKLYSITKALGGSPGTTGSPAQFVIITGEQVFKFLANSVSPVSNTITLDASLYGGLTTYDWEYWNGSSWVNLSGSNISPTYTLAYNNAAWGSATSLRIRCVSNATAGSPYDEITVVKLYDANETVTGYLTNENVTIPADYTGSPVSFTGGSGSFPIYRGTSPILSGVVYVTSPSTVSAGESRVLKNGLVFAINQTTGNYSVSASPAWTSNQEVFNVKATYGGVTIDKLYTISKARAGSPGTSGADGAAGSPAQYVVVTGQQIFKYEQAISSPTTSTITLTASRFGGLVSGTWQYWNGTAWANLTAPNTNDTYDLNHSALEWNNYSSLRVRYYSAPYYDEITVYKVYDKANRRSEIETKFPDTYVGPPAPANSGHWQRTGGVATAYSSISPTVTPYGRIENILSLGGSSPAGNPGTFNEWRQYFRPDPNKSYVAYVWVRKRSETTTRGLYIGWQANGLSPGAELLNSYSGVAFPYTIEDQATNLSPAGKWFLTAGVLRDQNWTSGLTNWAGLWDPSTNTRLYSGKEWRQVQGSPLVTNSIRLLFYSNTTALGTNDGFDYYPIGLYTIDGTEPTVQEVIAQYPDKFGGSLTGYLTNENVTIPADYQGSPNSYYLGTGNFNVLRGTKDITKTAFFSIVGGTDNGTNWTKTQNNLTLTIQEAGTNGGAYSLSGNTWLTASPEFFDLVATYEGETITKRFTVSKTYAGSPGVSGANAQYVILSGGQAFIFPANSISPTSNTVTLNASLYGGLTTYDWEYWNGTTWANLEGNNTSPDYTLSYNASPWMGRRDLRVRCLSGSAWDEMTITKIYDGNDPVTGYLTNENHTVATDTVGSPVSFSSAGGSFIVYRGISPVLNGVTYSTSPSTIQGGESKVTKNGLVFAINQTTGLYNVSTSPQWLANYTTFHVKATYGGVTIDKTYTISKTTPNSNGLIVNSSFETGTFDGWTATADASIVAGQGRSGVYAARLLCSPGGPNLITRRYSVNPGQVVYASAYAKRDESAIPGDTQTIALRWYDSGGSFVGGRTALTGAAAPSTGLSGWQFTGGEATAPATTTNFSVDLGEGNTTGAWYWDDVYADIRDPARYVVINGPQTFNFLANSISPTYNSIVLQATLFGGLTTYDWEYWNGSAWVNLEGTQNTSSYTLTYNASPWLGNNNIRIRCVSDALAGSPYDEITVVKLYDGDNPISGFLTNENHTVAADYMGSPVTLVTAGGTFKVYRGTSPAGAPVFTTSPSYIAGSESRARKNGLVFGINQSTGDYSLSLSPTWTSTSESFNVKATYAGTTIEKTYTISKALAGSPGLDGAVVNMRGNFAIEKATGATKSVTAVAADLIKSTGVDTSGVTYKWYEGATQISTSLAGYTTKYGLKTSTAGNIPSGSNSDLGINIPTVGNSSIYNTLVVSENAVTNLGVYKVEVTDSTNKVFTQYFTLYDVSDPYDVKISSTGGDKLLNGTGQTYLTPVVYYGGSQIVDLTGWNFRWRIYTQEGYECGFVDTTKIASGGATITSNSYGTAATFTYSGTSYNFVAGDLIKIVGKDGSIRFYEVNNSSTNSVSIRAPLTSQASFAYWPEPAIINQFVGGKLFGCTSAGSLAGVGGRETAGSMYILVTGDDIDTKNRIIIEAFRPD